MVQKTVLSRRKFIKTSGLLALGSYALPKIVLAHSVPEKSLHFYNVNTGEYFREVFWAQGQFIPESVKLLNHFLRDWRANLTIDMCPDLFLLIHQIQEQMDAKKPLDIICGYRSQQTNDALRRTRKGVAKFSRHMTGHAIDFSIPGKDLAKTRDCALTFKKGGVGYYPKSGFIHVDIRDKPARW